MKPTILILIVCLVIVGIYWGSTHGAQDCEFMEANKTCSSANYISWYPIRNWIIETLAHGDTIIINAQFGMSDKCYMGGKNTKWVLEGDFTGALISNTDEYSPTLCLGIMERRKGKYNHPLGERGS